MLNLAKIFLPIDFSDRSAGTHADTWPERLAEARKTLDCFLNAGLLPEG